MPPTGPQQPPAIDGEDYVPLKEVILERLRQEIVSGQRLPGDRIKERDIAEEMQFSRVPVREALAQLRADGLIEFFPRKGAVVRALGIKDVDELFEIREMIEPRVYQLAAERATDDDVRGLEALMAHAHECLEAGNFDGVRDASIQFHQAILDLTKNDAMIQMFGPIFNKIQWLLAGHHRFDEIDGDHADILTAIKNHDVEQALICAKRHSSGNRERITEIFTQRSANARRTPPRSRPHGA